ncbi:MAG: hypothetical protein AB9836_07485 [Aminipila sp.]
MSDNKEIINGIEIDDTWSDAAKNFVRTHGRKMLIGIKRTSGMTQRSRKYEINTLKFQRYNFNKKMRALN